MKCLVCKKKDIDEHLKSFCSKNCRNIYARRYYAKNRDKLNDYQKKKQSDRRAKENRPRRSVAMKAWETRKKNNIGMGKPWTTEEIKYIKKNYHKMLYKEMAKILDRAEGAVGRKLNRLGIHKE